MTISASGDRSLATRLPGFWRVQALLREMRFSRQGLRHLRDPFLRAAEPGHFYSPIPDLDYIRKHSSNLFARGRASIPGISLSADRQVALIEAMEPYYKDLPFSDDKQQALRYYFKNPYFGRGSSIILYAILRYFSPRRIVEVGSGFSSAAMLDVNDRFLEGSMRCTFVEPYPVRLHALLNESDRSRHSVCIDMAQHVPRSLYADLEANDILFIDSSHVAKVGSDVVFLLTEILPLLRKGVIIHIHDIYWPFEYPEDWVFSGRAWNEAYMVKAFLQFNDAFEILLFNSYLAIHQQAVMQRCLPGFMADPGSSLWLRKTS